jgi:hypothetical protein
VKAKPPARNPYLSQNELKALGRLMGALRPAKLATVRGAEIFQAGVHRGERYTVADLDDMVKNFKLARLVIDPPMVTGHEEDQSFLSDSGLPAAGWLLKVYRRGAKLFGDFGGIPRSIAKLINARAYRKVSVEVYDEPPEGAPAGCKGRMIRRVAILGSELPQIKTLSDLPLAEYSEAPPVCVPWRLLGSVDCVKAADGRAVRVTRFAEGADMAASEATAAMASAVKAAMPDLPQEFLDSLDDSQLAMLLQGVSGGDAGGGDAGGGDGGGAAAQAEWPEGVTRESAIADLVAAGEDAASLDAMSDDELIALWQEKVGGGAAPMSEPKKPVTAPVSPVVMARRFAELDRRLKAAEARAKHADKESFRRMKAERERTVNAYCERWAREGYVLPREVDKGAKVPNLYHRLMAADGTRVQKFGETSATAFDAAVAEIEERGPGFVRRFFSEKLAQPEGAKDGLFDVTEAAKKYAESRNGQARKRA